MAKSLKVNEIWIEHIVNSVSDLQFGSVQIIIHDGKIVQIERTERKRFDSNGGIQGQQNETRSIRRA